MDSTEQYGMSDERYQALMLDMESKLTEEEINLGWHWCFEFDGLLVNANDPDMKKCGCTCLDVK